MDLAKELDAADTYVELSRSNPGPQFEQIKKDNPYGFDIVIEATGSVRILEDAINYCRRGGTLVAYGYYLAPGVLKQYVGPNRTPNLQCLRQSRARLVAAFQDFR